MMMKPPPAKKTRAGIFRSDTEKSFAEMRAVQVADGLYLRRSKTPINIEKYTAGENRDESDTSSKERRTGSSYTCRRSISNPEAERGRRKNFSGRRQFHRRLRSQ